MTVTIAPDEKTTVEEVTADGKSRSWSFTPSGDTAVPIQGLDNATVIAKRTGNLEELTWNFDGENVKGRSVVSSNGTTYTATGTEKGHPSIMSSYSSDSDREAEARRPLIGEGRFPKCSLQDQDGLALVGCLLAGCEAALFSHSERGLVFGANEAGDEYRAPVFPAPIQDRVDPLFGP